MRMSETTTEPTTDAPQGAESKGEEKQADQTFTQADVDRIVKERVQRERAKFADYGELKEKAAGAKTAEERLASLESQLQESRREALVRRVQAAHGISDEDAELFLTGADEDALTAQAKRLADRETERKQNGNHVPKEGTTTRPEDNGEAAFARSIFNPGD